VSCAERGERRVRAVEARWELRGGLHREQRRGLARSGSAAYIGSSGAGSGGAAAKWEQLRLPRMQGCCSAEEAAALVGTGARHGERARTARGCVGGEVHGPAMEAARCELRRPTRVGCGASDTRARGRGEQLRGPARTGSSAHGASAPGGRSKKEGFAKITEGEIDRQC